MITKTSSRSIADKGNFARLGSWIGLGVLLGVYAVLVGSIDNNKLAVLLFAVPIGPDREGRHRYEVIFNAVP